MTFRTLLLAVAALPGVGAAAEGVPRALTERAAWTEEMRELLRASPEIVAPALGPTARMSRTIAQEMYADEIASDLARIEAEAARLFARDRPALGAADQPAEIALFVGPDCPACATARDELDTLAARLGVAATLIDVSDPEDAALMARLTLDQVPSYAMADKLIRGHMPAIALERYLSE
ncbi:hypothetical protein ROJ8625_01142 [Roseivivax jejudonensis]|uniref:Thioredoxin-like fold domain-containing protein n=1 Tax=Roseivivax jejudonensis TaxID=1529041 RepID=A0A1X6YPS9_9RHOB|nr:hypothetical protein [Roseivivax jejudonensis]SLN27610.1 hypothetical protein ROJ8625_01142 [Roseivivax jejudonensis]